MKLYYSPPSPFSRKARIAAALLGLTGKLDLVATDTLDPDDPIRDKTPLAKIPVLETDDGACVFDSAVIVAWLDQHAGGGLIPREPKAKFEALVLEALADGVTDAAVLSVYEGRYRDAHERSPKWLAHQRGKIDRALAFLEQAPPDFDGAPHVGHVALACALGYLDLRFEGEWRASHPNLVAWLERFAEGVPTFEATAFAPADVAPKQ